MKNWVIVFLILCFAEAGFAQWDDHSMHFPQTPKVGGWDIGSRTNNFTAADDWRCSKTGYATNIIFWGSWYQDFTGQIEQFLVTIYKDSVKEANVIWRGVSNNDDYPSRTEFDFTVKTMPPALQGWYDAVEYDPVFPEYSYDINDHQKWSEIDIHNFQEPFLLQQGTTYWIKIEEMWVSDPNYIDDGSFHIYPTFGWKESDKHFGNAAKIYCDPCTGWKILKDPITGSVIDLAFVIVTAPRPGDLTKDGKVDYKDVMDLADSWLENSFRSRQIKELIGRWEFEESDSNDPALDSSGNENTATAYNGAYRLDGAMVFDGMDDYLQTAADGNKLQLSGDYTLTTWIQADAVQKQWAGIISKSNLQLVGLPQNQWSMQFGSVTTNTLDKIIVFNSMTYWDSDIKLSDLAGSWHHAAIVRSENSMISFLDGKIKKYSSSFMQNPISGMGSLKIGTEKNGGLCYKGQLDDIRIYDYPLSPEEIQLIYQGLELPEAQTQVVCYEIRYGDLNSDCQINSEDFAIIANNWLKGVHLN